MQAVQLSCIRTHGNAGSCMAALWRQNAGFIDRLFSVQRLQLIKMKLRAKHRHLVAKVSPGHNAIIINTHIRETLTRPSA